jgi:hypothetical protein
MQMTMQKKLSLLLTITLLVGAQIGSPRLMAPHSEGAMAYVEPGLLASDDDTLSVIVTASDSKAAARAVEDVGGQVRSELWLIDAMAVGQAGQLRTLLWPHSTVF